MQQLRWRRSGLRDLFWTLRTFRRNLNVMHPLTMVNMLIPGTLTLLWPSMYIYALSSGWVAEHLFLEMPLYFAAYVVIGVLFNVYAHRHNPEQKVSPLMVGSLGMWFIVDSFFTTLVALCTFDVGEWGTRGTSEKKDMTSDAVCASRGPPAGRDTVVADLRPQPTVMAASPARSGEREEALEAAEA